MDFRDKISYYMKIIQNIGPGQISVSSVRNCGEYTLCIFCTLLYNMPTLRISPLLNLIDDGSFIVYTRYQTKSFFHPFRSNETFGNKRDRD